MVQMLFLDQRGTGLSSAISAETLARHGKPQEQANYLRHFRADNIGSSREAHTFQTLQNAALF